MTEAEAQMVSEETSEETKMEALNGDGTDGTSMNGTETTTETPAPTTTPATATDAEER